MKRAALYTAVLASLAPFAALAESGNVEIYGTINADYEGVQATGSTPATTHPSNQLGVTPTGIDVPHRSRVTSNSSNIGVRGSQPLGSDLKALFQVESAVGFDNQATFGTNTANGSPVGGGFATRNTNVGLAGAWGSAFLGQWDTPYKVISGVVDPMYFTGIAYTGALIGTPGFGVAPVTNGNITLNAAGTTFANVSNASFERRQGNSVQYWTPFFGPLRAKVAYSVNEGKSSSAPSVTQINPRVWSTNLEYDKGPLYLAAAYEAHLDYFGLSALAPAGQAVSVAAAGSSATASSRDTGIKLVGRYVFGKTRLGLIVERLEYEQDNSVALATAFKTYERNAYALTAMHDIGPGTFRAIYGRATSGKCSLAGGGACVADGLGARQISLGYSVAYSDRLDLYAFYTRIANEANATYQFANGAGVGAAAGADNIGYLLGIRYTF
jgi:predicted porin